MAPKKQPWFPFYPDDWLSDEKLRACSSAARGLWIDVLSLMHKNDRRGYLQLSGSPVTPEQLARMTGRSTDEVTQQLAELFNAGVPSATDDGTIYSRRMTRDERKRQLCSEAGLKGGGNPALSKTSKGHTKGDGQTSVQRAPKGVSKLASDICILSSEEEKEDTQGEGGVGGGGGGEGPPKGGAKGQSKGIAGHAFDAFWAAYPAKKAKQDAMVAWNKLAPSKELCSLIMEALVRQKAWQQWQDGFIPHPATWLRGKRWEDQEPDIPGSACAPPRETPAELDARILRQRAEYEEQRAAAQRCQKTIMDFVRERSINHQEGNPDADTDAF